MENVIDHKLTLDPGVTRSQQSLLAAWDRKLQMEEWNPGEFLGSDLALSEEFGVSRTVVRGALEILERSGCIRRVPRRGVVLERGFTLDRRPQDAPPAEELFFIRWVDDTFVLDLLAGASAQADRCSFKFSQGMAHQSETVLVELLDHLPDNCRNLLMLPMESQAVIAAMRRALDRGVRIVQLDRYIEGLAAPAVIFDHCQGGVLATRHLLARHPGPVHYFGCMNPVSHRKRHQGWRDAMFEAGFVDLDRYVIPYPDDRRVELIRPEEFFAECRPLLAGFLRRSETPISIFAAGDAWARQVYQVAEELRLTVGKDIRLVGFDNLELCERLTPTLSSIAVPRRQLGAEAVRMLADNPRKMVGYCKILPVELIVRQSS